ncbi:tail length tape measure protein [Acinetobacter phage vB_AbaS_Silvergun]
MAKKFSIKRDPTFKTTIPLPVVGGKSVPVDFEFRYLDRKGLSEFQGSRVEFAREFGEFVSKPDTTSTQIAQMAIDFEVPQLKSIIVNWDIEEEFNDENLAALVESGSEITAAIVEGYFDAYVKAREGN